MSRYYFSPYLLYPLMLCSCFKEYKRKINIDGSSSVYPLTEAVAEEFRKQNGEIRITVGISGTGGGFKKFLRGETDITNASRPISPEELKVSRINGIEFIEIPVCYDGLAIKSIFENVAFGLRINGESSKLVLQEIVESALRQAALWEEVKDNLNKSALTLSGGQQQRLCIARAIAVKPSVLLMDEPASSLDPISTAKIEGLIYQLKDQFTIVIVTHNMEQAARVSDKTAFFYLGELIEFDKTDKIFTNPSIEATQNYITGRFG